MNSLLCKRKSLKTTAWNLNQDSAICGPILIIQESYNKQHLHPNSQWSGVYYVRVPKNSGSLFVEDPSPGPNIRMPRRLKGIPRGLWRVVLYPAIEGQMIMFPAWLSHGVEMNESKEKGEKGWRVSVFF